MDLEEVKVCLRALLSSNPMTYSLKSLLNDFKSTTGFNLPLFGYSDPLQFLMSLEDTVKLQGDPCNPVVALVESKKSAHIISLVDRQRVNERLKTKNPFIIATQRRQLVPLKSAGKLESSMEDYLCSSSFNFNQPRDLDLKVTMVGPMNFQNLQLSSTKQTLQQTFIELPESNVRGSISHNFLTQAKSPLIVKNQYQNLEIQKTADTKAQKTLYNKCITSSPLQMRHQVEKTSSEATEKPKSSSCFFEDDSDSDNCQITEERSGGSSPDLPALCDTINSGLKNKLKKLIKNHPGGLWCCELPEIFFEKFHFMLDYREYGYTSLIQMLSELPDVFRCIRPGNEDWILFDASVPPSPEEKRIQDFQMRGDALSEIKSNIQKLLSRSCDNCSLGVELDKVRELYQNMFGKDLDFQSVGFKDLKSLLEVWEGSILYLIHVGGKLFCGPAFGRSVYSPVRWEEALPPITAENDIFVELFPKEVVGPEERLVVLDLTRHIAVGHVVEVCVAEVWSPSKFYIQLNKFKNRLTRFMDDLQKFYTVHLSKYKMPESTIRPNQVCVGLYNADPEFPDEWHRAEIIKVINEKTVLINFVDYGTVTRVKKSQLRFLHRSFQSFPIQAFQAQLSGVAPPNDEGTWPMSISKKFLELLRIPYLSAEMVDIDFKKPTLSVILFDSFQKPKLNINKKLVMEKLAKAVEPLYFQEVTPEVTSPEDRTRRLSEISSNGLVQENENFSKNVTEKTDQFLDIDDLSQSTLFHFRMKSLMPETREKKDEASKKVDPTVVSYEFDEIPELKKSQDEKKMEAETKQKTPKDIPIVTDVPSVATASPEPIEKQPEKKNLTCKTPLPIPNDKSQPGATLIGHIPPTKPKRLPPGLEHHVNALCDFDKIPLLLQSQDLKRRINILALDLLSKNESIKQVGMNDPVLALKIATEMAEAYMSAQVSMNLRMCCYNLYPPVPLPSIASEAHVKTPGPETPGPALPDDSQPTGTASQDVKSSECADMTAKQDGLCASPEKVKLNRNSRVESKGYVEQVRIDGKILNLIKVDKELYVNAEEVVRQFTVFSNREVSDRVLHAKKIPTDYKVISKKSDEELLRILKSCDLMKTVKGKSKKLKIYLLQVSKVVPYLQALGCQTKAFENEFLELKENWEEMKSQKEPS